MIFETFEKISDISVEKGGRGPKKWDVWHLHGHHCMVNEKTKIEKIIRFEVLKLPKSKIKGRDGSTINTLPNLSPDIYETSLRSNFS